MLAAIAESPVRPVRDREIWQRPDMRKAGMDKCTVMPCWAYKCIWLCWHSEAQVGQNFYGMGLRSMTIPALLLPLLLVMWDPPSHVLAHSGSSMVPSGNETACVQANGACHAHVHQRAGCSSASADCTTAHVPIATCVSAPVFPIGARARGGIAPHRARRAGRSRAACWAGRGAPPVWMHGGPMARASAPDGAAALTD